MTGAKEIKIQGKKLKCTFCGGDKFFDFDVRLNTFSTTFLSGFWSFIAKKAYACEKCGLKQEFVDKK